MNQSSDASKIFRMTASAPNYQPNKASDIPNTAGNETTSGFHVRNNASSYHPDADFTLHSAANTQPKHG